MYLIGSNKGMFTISGSYPIPSRPRVFVTHYRDETLTDYSVAVHFRWSSPVSVENFTLSSYNVLVSNTINMWLSNESVPDNHLEYGLEPAPKNAMLYFKVCFLLLLWTLDWSWHIVSLISFAFTKKQCWNKVYWLDVFCAAHFILLSLTVCRGVNDWSAIFMCTLNHGSIHRL